MMTMTTQLMMYFARPSREFSNLKDIDQVPEFMFQEIVLDWVFSNKYETKNVRNFAQVRILLQHS